MKYVVNEKNKINLAFDLAKEIVLNNLNPLFLCVGTDKVISDSLAPIVAELLKHKYKIKNKVVGDLIYNINSKNLKNAVSEIKKKYPYNTIFLIDSTLGSFEDLGDVIFKKDGSIAGGLNGHIEKIGEYSILGISSCYGATNKILLNGTRLSLILKMANFIADAINLSNILKNNVFN